MIKLNLLKKYIAQIKSASRNRGVFPTMRMVISDFLFDWKYGTDTQASINSQSLETFDGYNSEVFYGYDAVHFLVMKQILKDAKIDVGNSTLLDIGSGKGRVIIYAGLIGFKNVIGLELSPMLCEISKKNITLLNKKGVLKTEVEVVNQNAIEYQIPHEVNVVFLFNPFKEDIMEKVLINIEKSLKESYRPLKIIYVNPRHSSPFEESPFSKYKTLKNKNKVEAIIYTN